MQRMYTYMQNFPALYSPYATGPFTSGFMLALMPFIIIAAIWTIIIKGYALWHAARGGQKWWFIALLAINTLGILEIVYLIWFRPTTSHTSKSEVSSSTQA
jgi:methionyl-tRNA synthetase